MGNALVMMVVPEESLALNGLHVRDRETGKLVPVARKVGLGSYEDTLRANPDATWTIEVPVSAVWLLPNEPRDAHGSEWHRKPRVLAAHRATMKRSLEAFLNRSLEGLDGMARSGWFILARARAKVAELREVPHSPEPK
jgi:hypothetical protein